MSASKTKNCQTPSHHFARLFTALFLCSVLANVNAATNQVSFDLGIFTSGNVAYKQVRIVPSRSTFPRAEGNQVVGIDYGYFTTDANGKFTNNIVTGTYDIEFTNRFTLSRFQITTPSTNAGRVLTAAELTTSGTNLPSNLVAYSQTAANAYFVHGVAPGTNVTTSTNNGVVTVNASGGGNTNGLATTNYVNSGDTTVSNALFLTLTNYDAITSNALYNALDMARTNAPLFRIVDFATLANSTSSNVTAPNGLFFSQFSSSPGTYGVVTNGYFYWDPWRCTNSGTAATHLYFTNSDGALAETFFVEYSQWGVTNSGAGTASPTVPVILASSSPLLLPGLTPPTLTNTFHVGINPSGIVGVLMTNGVANGTNLVSFGFTNTFLGNYNGERHVLWMQFLGNNAMIVGLDGESYRFTNAFVEAMRPAPGTNWFGSIEASGTSNSCNTIRFHRLGFGNRSFGEQLQLTAPPKIANYAESNGVVNLGKRIGVASAQRVGGWSFANSNTLGVIDIDGPGHVILNQGSAGKLGATLPFDSGLTVMSARDGSEASEYQLTVVGAAASDSGYPTLIRFQHLSAGSIFTDWLIGVLANDAGTNFSFRNSRTGVSQFTLKDGKNEFAAHMVPASPVLYDLGSPSNALKTAYVKDGYITNITASTVTLPGGDVQTQITANTASLNTLSNNAVTNIVLGTSGNAPNITRSGNTVTNNFPTADTTHSGILSSSDWATFNNKVSRSGDTMTGPLIVSNGVLSANAPGLAISQTWNNSGQVFTALLVNATNTASASGTALMDLQIGGSSQFIVNRSGNIVMQGASIYAQGINMPSASSISINGDVVFGRQTAATFALRNSTSAQTINIFDTVLGATNQFLQLSASNFPGYYYIGSLAVGSGATNKPVALSANGSAGQLVLATNGNVGAGTSSPEERVDVAGITKTRGLRLGKTNAVYTAGAFTNVSQDSILFMSNNSARTNFLNSATATNGTMITIKDWGRTASGTNIYITATGGAVEGATYPTIGYTISTDSGAVTFQFDGTNWFGLSKF